jgi:hypothetical protein
VNKWIVIPACLVLAGCIEPFSIDEANASQELLKIAPVGSDARNALPILEGKGFRCQWLQQEQFKGIEGKHDYLYCDLGRMAGFLVERRWQLALIHKNFVVTDAKFGIGLTGP